MQIEIVVASDGDCWWWDKAVKRSAISHIDDLWTEASRNEKAMSYERLNETNKWRFILLEMILFVNLQQFKTVFL